MANTHNGQVLTVGQLVNVPGKVTAIDDNKGEITVETIWPKDSVSDVRTVFNVNALQSELRK